jgi:[acyl-carrier-protein] S-malonyltransferase
MVKTAWVFPGQGSQAIGMGADLVGLDLAQSRLAEADAILGWSIMEICQGDEARLGNTQFTQPCLYVIESILADLLKDKGYEPELLAGHSLGEYSALYAAGVFDFAVGVHLVKRRAELMAQAADGAMAALMGCDRNELDTAIAATPGVVLANDNNATQVVISGTPEAVDIIMATVKSKRAVKLNVSGAFHSPLMAAAASEFGEILAAVEFRDALWPVLSNVEPTPSSEASVLKGRLNQQMTGSVRWREISLQLAEAGMTDVIEVGPGNVLTGLVKRTCKDLVLKNVSALEHLTTLG